MDPKDQIAKNPEKKVSGESIYDPDMPLFLRERFTPQQWEAFTYEQRAILKDLDNIPEKLTGVVPESVWDTLSLDQKLEFLFTHELLPSRASTFSAPIEREEYEQFRRELEGLESEQSTQQQPSAENKEMSFIESSKEFDRLKAEVKEIEGQSAEKQGSPESRVEKEEIDPGDVERIKNESGATFSTSSMPRFAGYQPDQQFLAQVEQNASGSPKKSKTWTANIIKRIWLSISP